MTHDDRHRRHRARARRQAPAPAQSCGGLLAADGDRPPPVRHARRARRHPARLPHPDRRQAHQARPTWSRWRSRRPAWPIMATGMVLIIVSRNIDLSVGSLVGVIAMIYALLMTDFLPDVLGIPVGSPLHVGRRPRASASGSGAAHRRPPGLHHRLRRRALVRRHPRRAALHPRRRLGALRAARRSPASTPPSSSSAAGPSGSLGRASRPGSSASSAASPSSGCSSTTGGSAGASASRSGRCGPRSCSAIVGCVRRARRWPPSPTQNFWPKGLADRMRRGARHRGTGRRAADPDGLLVADHPAHRRRPS